MSDPKPMGKLAWVVTIFILAPYSTLSGLNNVQVVLSGFSVRLLCFVWGKTLCRYGCMYILSAPVCVDVMSSA